jgi:hypothetical protein
MNATKVGSQNLNISAQFAEPGRDNIRKDLTKTGRNNANVMVRFELLTSCRLLMKVITELCVPFVLQIFFQNLNEHYSTRTKSASVTQLFSSSRALGWFISKGSGKVFSCLMPRGYVTYHQVLTFRNSTFCPHSVCVFCVDLRTNSDYCPIQH